MGRRDNAPKKTKTKNVLTSNQREWKHQVENLKKRIRSLEELGAVVDFAIPEMPKRVTKKAIEAIKGIRRKQLEKKAYQSNNDGIEVNEQGEAKPYTPPKRGETKRRLKEVKARRKAKEIFDEDYSDYYEDEEYYAPDYDYPYYSYTDTDAPNIYDVVVDNLRSFIENYGSNVPSFRMNYETQSKLLNTLDRAIQEVGVQEIASRAEDITELYGLAERALYDSKDERIKMHLRGFADVLFGNNGSRDFKIDMEQVYEDLGLYG